MPSAIRRSIMVCAIRLLNANASQIEDSDSCAIGVLSALAEYYRTCNEVGICPQVGRNILPQSLRQRCSGSFFLTTTPNHLQLQ